MRVLLIGGNGFIGTPLSRELLAAGHEIAILHRGKSVPDASPAVRHIQGDRKRLSQYRDQLGKFAPDVIVDLILSSGNQANELMTVAPDITGRVVALSSGDVYRAWGVLHRVESGPLEPLPITEDSPLRTTRSLYSSEMLRKMKVIFEWATEDYDKIAVEESVMSQAKVPGTILRLPMVYGPGDLAHRFFPVVKRFADRRPAIILPEDFAGWCGPRGYVDNVGHAIALCITDDRAAGRIYNVCEEPCFPELEWQKRIAYQTDWRGNFVVLAADRTPPHLRLSANAAQHAVISSQRIRAELGYEEIIPREEGIRRTIAWELTNPPAINPQQFDYGAEDAALAQCGLSA
jgi:nucleoside-diphosphate-sugar epimerase